MKRIFLSGGTHGGWRDAIVRKFPDVQFYDPSTLRHHTDMHIIAKIEREWLDECDCIFFYFERENPSGLGSAFEIGYGVANKIPTFFVDEKQTSHSTWLACHCDFVFASIDEGILALTSWLSKGS